MSRDLNDLRSGWQTVKEISDLRAEQRGFRSRAWTGVRRDLVNDLAEGEIQQIVSVMMGR